MEKNREKGFLFKKYEAPFQSPFDKLFEIFKELITHTSGDFEEAIDWLRQLDVEYKLTDSNYTIDDFIEDLKKNDSKNDSKKYDYDINRIKKWKKKDSSHILHGGNIQKGNINRENKQKMDIIDKLIKEILNIEKKLKNNNK
jgi:hypothetical protein